MANKDDKKPKPGIDARWHAVAIVSGTNACAAVQAVAKQRFLSKNAPRLPLPECTLPASCKCAYKHHKDRRSSPRRWTEQGGTARQRPPSERRAKRGRREFD
jgi:hypothetical protein